MNWLAFFGKLAADAPHLLAEGFKLYSDIATGAGGAGKVAAVAGDVAGLAAGAATAVQQQQPQ